MKNEVKVDVNYVKEGREEYSSIVLKINAMNNITEKLLSDESKNPKQSQLKIDNIFQVHELNFADYEEISEKHKAWLNEPVNVKNLHSRVSPRLIQGTKRVCKDHVTILKEFQDWQNIIEFYELTTDGSKRIW